MYFDSRLFSNFSLWEMYLKYYLKNRLVLLKMTLTSLLDYLPLQQILARVHKKPRDNWIILWGLSCLQRMQVVLHTLKCVIFFLHFIHSSNIHFYRGRTGVNLRSIFSGLWYTTHAKILTDDSPQRLCLINCLKTHPFSDISRLYSEIVTLLLSKSFLCDSILQWYLGTHL